MDETETKTCLNCKREILASNFVLHNVHCARNIKMCPVCKEAVPQSELEEHHEKMHKPLPCKQCGDSVCGTDMEDHVRDSCANTIKSCRYCELELPRRDLPPHEAYCGARTEQCPECREFVMMKYRQLHKDSNHGFIRLDDDPIPVKAVSKRTVVPVVNGNVAGPATYAGAASGSTASPVTNGAGGSSDRAKKELNRGALKKRAAPRPPRAADPEPARQLIRSVVTFPEPQVRPHRTILGERQNHMHPAALGRPDDDTGAANAVRWDRDDQFKDMTPMSPSEFMDRFNELQLRNRALKQHGANTDANHDRFSEIKSSLRELRRGLNAVTAPYNSGANGANSNGNREAPPTANTNSQEVRLPCEFCAELVPADDLVQHQSGCRPELFSAPPRLPLSCNLPRPARPRRPAPPSPDAIVIPCEFCTESLPVYLINEHQERCQREPNRIFPD